VKSLKGEGKLIVLQSNDLKVVNSFEQQPVVPKESVFNVKSKTFTLTALPYSFSVLRVKLIGISKKK
jgi:alpha-L-arabinofuranosidase